MRNDIESATGESRWAFFAENEKNGHLAIPVLRLVVNKLNITQQA